MTASLRQTEATGPLVLVVGIASNRSDDVVWDETQRIAQHAAPAVVHVVHVVEPRSSAIPLAGLEVESTIQDLRERDVREFIESRLRGRTTSCRGSIWVHVLHGNAADRIAQFAAECDADAIVIGSVGSRGLTEMESDSTALSLFRSSPCSVLLARPKDATATPRTRSSTQDARAIAQVHWIQ